jgi:transcription initiation factor IIE alpha subunit
MADLTVYAESLIATVARAFYDDDAVCLIDVLLRDKFLRDDDMAPRLSLPAKKLRSTLQFLQEEHLVKFETVDDLTQGGSQATKFWYIDYNHAVHTIRLRLHLLRKQLEKAEMRARSSSFYLCPGYKQKRCNGRYTEEEAQQMVDHSSGLFVCQECYLNYEADPNAPDVETYTLQLVDNTKDLRVAMDNVRRVNVQLSGKMIGNQQLRAGIYDLINKVRGKGKDPITSNLPSENFALGIGSKRLAGTGRTAGIKARKLEQQGVADSATAARDYLVGGGKRSAEGSDLTFLKNAMGNEIAFSVEKGGGARANLLATRTRRRRKLMDAAATRVGTSVPLEVRLKEEQKRKQQQEEERKAEAKRNGNLLIGSSGKQPSTAPLSFLNNNIGRMDFDEEMERMRQRDVEQAEELEQEEEDEEEDRQNGTMGREILLLDDMEETPHLWEEEARKAAFQSHYSKEMGRQVQLLELEPDTIMMSSPPKLSWQTSVASATSNGGGGTENDGDDSSVMWEDCEV